jgi:ATP-dependent DNA ligase
VTLASGAKCMTTEPSDLVFRHACKMGLEGIVSKRIGSRCRSGSSLDRIKSNNPVTPAVRGEAEEDRGRRTDLRQSLRSAGEGSLHGY